MTNSTDEQPRKGFLVWDMIGQGWQCMKKNVWQLLGLQVILLVIYFLLLGIIDFLFPVGPNVAWILSTTNTIASFLVHECFFIGIITLSLRFADSVPVTFKDFFSKMHVVLNYIVASILASVAIILGLICLVVPGIIIWARFGMFGYFIVDKNMGPLEALRASWDLVKGVTWSMIGFWLACLVVIVLGLLCLGVGLLFAYPVATIASAILYRKLNAQDAITSIEVIK